MKWFMKTTVLCCLLLKSMITTSTRMYFSCNEEYYCPDRLVQHQCTVTDSPLLSWIILDSNMTTIDTYIYSIDSVLNVTHKIQQANGFTVVLIAKSETVFTSTISFTAKSSINNGYTIQCKGFGTIIEEECAVNIAGIPPPPDNLIIQHRTNVTTISWSPLVSYKCVTGYIVNSNATNSPITTTDTSVTIPLDGLSAGVYCVSVAAVDTANRTGEYSEEECFELTVPTPPEIIVLGKNIIRFTVKFNQSVIPFVTAAHAMINNTAVYSSARESSDEQSFTFQAKVQCGANYIVTAFGENCLGNGSSTSRLIYIDSDDVSSTTASFTPAATATPAATTDDEQDDPTTNSNRYDERDGIFSNSNDDSVDVVIIVVLVVCGLGILFIPLILLLILFVFIKRKHMKSHNISSPRAVDEEGSKGNSKENGTRSASQPSPTNKRCVTQFNTYEITEDPSSTHEMQRHGSKHTNRASKRKRSMRTHSGGKQRAQTEIVELNSQYSCVTQVPTNTNRHKPDVNNNNYDSIGKPAISISLPSTYCFVSAPEQSDGKQTEVQTEIGQVNSQYSHLARVPTDTNGHRPKIDHNNYDIIGKPAVSAYCPKQTEGQTETAQVNSQHSCVTQIPTDGHEQADVTIRDHHKPVCTSIPPSAYCFVSPDNFN